MIEGAYTLVITPFDKKMNLDEEGLRLLVRRQLKAGVDGIAPLGTTGEIYALSEEEIERVVKTIVDEVNGKCKIIPEIASNNIEVSIKRANMYADLGCEHTVAYAPFLAKPNQEGIISFFKILADKSKIPILLHNSEGRTGVNMEPTTTAELAKHENIIGIKDGNKKIDHLAKLIHLTQDLDFGVFTAKDTTAFPSMSFGANGVFTVSGNVIPKEMKEMVDNCLHGNRMKAKKIHDKYYEFFEAMRFETNPMATKEAMNMIELPSGKVRLPLIRLNEKNRNVLPGILKRCGLNE